MSTTNQYLPLAENQYGLWHVQNIHPDLHAYNASSVFRVRSQLSILRLQRALNQLVAQQPSLRTTFELQDGTPYRVVHETLTPTFEQIMLPAVDEAELRRIVQTAHERAFDLRTGPLVRLSIFTLRGDDHVLLLTFHHILFDFGSQSKVTQRLFDLYVDEPEAVSLISARQSEYDYDDFVAWQQDYLASPAATKSRNYWIQQLQAPLPVLELPTDHPLPHQHSFNGDVIRFDLPATLSQGLVDLARRQQVTHFTLLLTAFSVLMARYSNQDDIMIGIPSDERTRAPRFQAVLGHMVNILPIRVDLSNQPVFIDLLQQTQRVVMGGLFHQHYPFTRMVQDAQWMHIPNRSPFYDVAFNMPVLKKAADFVTLMEGTTAHSLNYKGLELEPFHFCQQAAPAFMKLDLWSTETGMTGFLKYNPDIFTQNRAQVIITQYLSLLEQIAANPEQSIQQYSLLTPNAPVPNPTKLLSAQWIGAVHDLFSQQARKTPGDLALLAENKCWTYRDLDNITNKLANYLVTNGIESEDVIAIYAKRCAELVAAILGILKSGAAFLILDPAYPDERLISYLQLVNPKGFLKVDAQPLSARLSSQLSTIEIHLELPNAELDNYSDMMPGIKVGPDDLAVVTFTSGSTGQPKGVLGRHGPLTHFLPWQQENFDLQKSDRYCMLSGLAHDPLQRDIFTPLSLGATICIPSAEEYSQPSHLATWMREQKITIAQLTPAMIQLLAIGLQNKSGNAAKITTLRRAFVIGDVLTKQDVSSITQLAPNVSVINSYGSTETQRAVGYFTVGSTAQETYSKHTIQAGKGFQDVQLLILNRAQQIAGIGELGEIFVRSPHLARGYLNDKQLTNNKFITNPFTQQTEDRLYKTGDLGRYLPDGNVEFVGRIDNQVKIRGFRIELGEIESALLALDDVREVAVLAREENEGDKRLVAYVVAAEEPGRQRDISLRPRDLSGSLRKVLTQQLPDYMVPSAFVFLDAMPLTPNGKLDRRALPAPEYSDGGATFVAPRTEMEAQLAAIWQQVLGVKQVGVFDNFFALGGHSLLATRVVSHVRNQLGRDVPLKTLFGAARLGDFAAAVVDASQDESSTILPVPRDQPLPLSFSQQRLWFLDQLEPDSAFYTMPKLLRLTGKLDVAALETSLRHLIERHESLRTVYGPLSGFSVNKGENGAHPVHGKAGEVGEPVQFIHPPTWAAQFNLTICPVADALEAQRLAQIEINKPFDLSKGPLLRVQLFQIAEDDAFLLLTMHHIIGDGWSLSVLVRELTHFYQAYTVGQQLSLPHLPIQYADFAVWQRELLSPGAPGARLETQLAYWRTQLTGAPVLLELPTDRSRPLVQGYQGAYYVFELESDLTTKLNQLAQQHDATLFMVLLATWNILLARYSRQDDIVVGSLIANRNRAEIEGLIGFFVNSLPLRVQLANNLTFAELLAQVRQTTLDAYAHQDLPFEQLIDELNLERSPSYSPLFQVMMILQNNEAAAFTLPNLTVTEQPHDFPFARYDLSLYWRERNGSLEGTFEYSTLLFNQETIIHMAKHLTTLLEQIVSIHTLTATKGQLDPDTPVMQLPIFTAAEYHQIMHEWNDTTVDFGEPQPFHTLFEQQVKRTPHAVAVVFEEMQLTYTELNHRANQLAHRLRREGLIDGAEMVVGVCMERCPETVISLLAIFKAGGVYLPLDPELPQERLAYMLTNARAQVVLTKQPYLAPLSGLDAEPAVQLIVLDSELAAISMEPTENLPSLSTPEQLAYVIYTSGSTGLPKGAMVEHQGMVNHLYAKVHDLDLTANDKIAETAPQSFDISIWQFLAGFLVGGAVHILDDETVRDPAQLLARTEAEQITILEVVPSLFRFMLDELALPETIDNRVRPPFAALRWLLLTGEALPPHLCNAWFRYYPDIPLMNAYGPTECSDDVTHHVIAEPLPADVNTVPIGRAVANIHLYILDEYQQPVPIGALGELYVGGIGVGRGYLNDPDRTANAFLDDPFVQGKKGKGRFYRTGDLVRYQADGTIEFLGRTDSQVKLRGFRIELSEIEATLHNHPDVKAAAVIIRQEAGEEKQLVAYVVANEAKDEIENQQMATWENVWSTIYAETDGQILTDDESTLNMAGWYSSYLNQPIPAVEVKEWTENAVAEIRSFKPQRVLEIGCGIGLMLTRLAPSCEVYWGTDYSQQALTDVARFCVNNPKLAHVHLEQRMADDFTNMPEGWFDCVSLNSIIQYFPSVDYLLRVLTGAVKLVKPGGIIYVGDVRNVQLMDAFHASVQAYEAADDVTSTQLQRQIQQHVRMEEELLVAPTFFHALQQKFPTIRLVEVRLKRAQYNNEFSRYRYQVVLHITDEKEPFVDLSHFTDREWQWSDIGSLDLLQNHLQTEAPTALILRNIPNARVQADLFLLDALSNQPQATLGQLRPGLADNLDGIEPKLLCAIEECLPYQVTLTWSAELGKFDACLIHQEAQDFATLQMSMLKILYNTAHNVSRSKPWHTYTNNPLLDKLNRVFLPKLRRYLESKLPEYMLPSAFVLLDALPLTPNGKLDRRALPAPDYTAVQSEFVAPQTALEAQIAAIWQEVLGIAQVGVHDNFFDLGGHSLLATQLLRRIRQITGHELLLRQIFATPTIRGLLQSMTQEQLVTTSFVPLRMGEKSSTPLFLIHAVSGVVFPFVTLLPYLPDTQPVYALQARRIYDDLPPFVSIEELATATIQEMKTIQPIGPYHIAGWSFGGMVAFEIASQLHAQGDEVAFTGIIDTYPPMNNQQVDKDEWTAQKELQAFFHMLGDIIHMDLRSLDINIFDQAVNQAEPIEWLLDQMSTHDVPPAIDPAIVKRIWVTLKHNIQLIQSYQPRCYDGSLTLFCAEESAPTDGPQRWQPLTPRPIETVFVSGKHQTMLNKEHVERLGRALAARLPTG